MIWKTFSNVATRTKFATVLGLMAVCVGNVSLLLGQTTTQPVVAIHDSELTRALESMPAVAPTPTGDGTTGFQWWPTDWHYFVLPESVQEAMRSDGTPFAVIADTNVTAGLLLSNGTPKFPIIISLGSEAIRDEEIAPLTNYVAAGGFLLVGSSAFTRYPDGSSRGDFAFANELGVHMWVPGLTNWIGNRGLTRQKSHRLVNHLPDGTLYWRMPAAADEINWGVSPSHPYLTPHDVWRTYVGDATVLAQGDEAPYLAIKPFGKGHFIYTAAFQPLIGHGGFAPGMYAYMILRNAIEWACESSRLPIARVGPWPYAYDAAFMVRHDLENFAPEIANLEASAQVEHNFGVKGDYYFCTGTLRQDMSGSYDTNAVIASLQRAVSQYGATIGPHNGGLKNPNNPSLGETEYDFWHWGLDEALETTPPGYPNGKAYAQASLAASFSDIENWLPGLMTNGLRLWAAPYFNATREDSYDIQNQLSVKIAGEQKLTPFPHWTTSTRISRKRYFLSEPVSDWFVGGMVAQSLEPWHPPGVHTTNTMHDAVDFYYGLGALINLYSHTLSTGQGDAGQLVPDYISYCLNTNLHPRLWAANAIDVYQWWTRRSQAKLNLNYSTNGSQATAAISLIGFTDPETTVEVTLPGVGTVSGLQVQTNGVIAAGSAFRMTGPKLKLRAGAITNAQISYVLAPEANDDFFPAEQGIRADIAAAGVLANDSSGLRPNISSVLATSTAHGSLNLSSNGGFSYMANPGFSGTDSFTYRAFDGLYNSPPATAYIMVYPAGTLFADDFSFSVDPSPIDPWIAQDGSWVLTGGVMQGRSSVSSYGNAYYDKPDWTDYTVQGRLRFSSANGYGGGLGGRLNSTNGAHYAAWLFPEGSPGGPANLRLIKFEGWSSWSFTAMQSVSVGSVGTNWHTLSLSFQSNNIAVSLDGVQQINTVDNHFDTVPPYPAGGVTVDMYSDSTAYNLSVDDVAVRSMSAPPVITAQPASVTTNTGSTVRFSVGAGGPQPLNYAWFKNGTNYLSDGGNVSGAATPTLTLINVSAADVGSYAALVTNPGGSATSALATLSISNPNPPVITRQPANVTTNAGSTVRFSIIASGSSPLSYAWFKNGTNHLSDGGNVSGSATPMLTLTSVSAADMGSYSALVTNPGGSATSTSASLNVTSQNPPVVTGQPANVTTNAGSTVRFSITASGPPPLSYAWFKNGTNHLTDAGNVSGSATPTLTLTSVAPSDVGSYAARVTNPGGTATSASASLNIRTPNPPVIVSQPQSQTVIAATPVSFSVSANGGAPLRYQWRFQGANLAGATNNALTLANPQPANAGQYAVVVSNTDGSVTSSPATLTVNYSLTVTSTRGGSVTVQPSAAYYAPGSSVSLKATAELGYDFTGWSGSASGTANPLSVIMNTNKVINANFKVNLLGQILGLL